MFGSSLRRQLAIISPKSIIRKYPGDSYADREHWSNLDDEEKARVIRNRKLKKWRNPMYPIDEKANVFDVSSVRQTFMNKAGSTDVTDWVNWFKRKQLEFLRFNQQWSADRVQTLGKDLALLHFIIYRKGKVRQKGKTNFLTLDDVVDESRVPPSYRPGWYVEEVDASGTDLMYEAIENFKELTRLKIVSFRNCKYFDDWCLERLICLTPCIEELDVSENEKITERGLEGLYRAWNLKKLIVTDWGHGPAFELTCLMLEDCMPDLKVIIKKPDGSYSYEGFNEPRLSQEERMIVIADASVKKDNPAVNDSC